MSSQSSSSSSSKNSSRRKVNNVIIRSAIPEYQLSDFAQLEQKGKGGDAVVFKGFFWKFGNVAIKEFCKPKMEAEMTEADLLIKHSRHPNIVQVYGLLLADDERGSTKYLGYVMEYMEFGSLNTTIHNPNVQYNFRQIYIWIQKAALGLSYLHEETIIHRDIKPSKIGSPFYMSPEVYKFNRYDYAADIYGFAISIWEMIYRSHPFHHLGDVQPLYVLQRVVTDGVRPVIQNNHPINSLLIRGWDEDPKQRPHLSEFVDFVKNAIDNEDSFPVVLKIVEEENSKIEETARDQIIFLGGKDSNDEIVDGIFILDYKTSSYKELPLKLPYKVYGHGAVCLDDEIYIFGGCRSEGDAINSTLKLGPEMKWEQLADMNECRYGISNSSVIYNGMIWVMGGSTDSKALKSVEAYDPANDEWIKKPDMNQRRYAAAATVIRNKIFVCGFSAGVEWFDSEGEKWFVLGRMPWPRIGLAIAADDPNLILLGGFYKSKNRKSAWMIDIRSDDDNWVELPSLKEAHSECCAAKIGNDIIIYGGCKSFGKAGSTVEIYDGEKWSYGSCLPMERAFYGSILLSAKMAKAIRDPDGKAALAKIKVEKELKKMSINSTNSETPNEGIPRADVFTNDQLKVEDCDNLVLIAGGKNGNNELQNDMYIMDYKNNGWFELSLYLPYKVNGHAMISLQNEIYVLGGEGETNNCYNHMYKLNQSMIWKKLANLTVKRYGITNSSVVFDGYIWVIGGWDGYNCLKSVEVYNPDSNTWMKMPDMHTARVSGSAVVIEKKIYALGGYGGHNFMNIVEWTDPSSGVWTKLCSLPHLRQGLVVIADKNKIILFGGWNAEICVSTVWSIDLEEETPTVRKMPSMNQGHTDFTAIKCGSQYIVFGGCNSFHEPSKTMEVFNGKKWTVPCFLPSERAFHASISMTLDIVKFMKDFVR